MKEIETYIKTAYFTNQAHHKYNHQAKDLVRKFGVKEKQIRKDSILTAVYNNLNISLAEINLLEDEYVSKLDVVLLDTIKKMQFRDREYRVQNERNKHLYSNEMLAKMIVQDSINQHRLIEIFETNHFPDCEDGILYNEDEFISLTTILSHTRDTIRVQYFMPKVMEFIKKGMCNPHVYAGMVDQYHLYNGEKQVYGSMKDYKKGRLVLSPAKHNRKEMNLLRRKIGLSSLDYEAWKYEIQNGISLEEYVIKNFKPKSIK